MEVKTGIYFEDRVDFPVVSPACIDVSGMLSFVPSSSDAASLIVLVVLAKVDFDVADGGFYCMTPIYLFVCVTPTLRDPALSVMLPFIPPPAIILGYPL